MRWVGIDEAGYGPNLGPLVMTAVVAESHDAAGNGRAPDLWGDLVETVDRAGGDPARLWVDDSKAILQRGQGRLRLELACLAAVHAVANGVPASFVDLLASLGAGTPADTELAHWQDPARDDPAWPAATALEALERLVADNPFQPRTERWRLAAIRTVVVGPRRFNQDLEALDVKSRVHFGAFVELLGPLWRLAADGRVTTVYCDKHGGRHYYLGPLSDAFPDAWIDRGKEGAELSHYTLRDPRRRLELSLFPRADGTEGLVALASIVSKAVRELWMDAFNAYWRHRVPGLRPTAGYPTDAHRFRAAIEAVAIAEGREPRLWWRAK